MKDADPGVGRPEISLSDATREERQRRAAINQSVFRSINDGAMKHTNKGAALLCECATMSCDVLLWLSGSEYEAIRAQPTHFVVAPGHVDEAVGRVVSETARYQVVELLEEAATLAAKLDARTRSSAALPAL